MVWRILGKMGCGCPICCAHGAGVVWRCTGTAPRTGPTRRRMGRKDGGRKKNLAPAIGVLLLSVLSLF